MSSYKIKIIYQNYKYNNLLTILTLLNKALTKKQDCVQ